jgi:LuxR family maltose regulon positive regulatory protein
MVLEALAHQANKQPQLALTTIEGVLAQAATEGYIRLFADEGEPMWALLTVFAGQTNMDRAARAYAHHILTVCGKGSLVELKANVPDYALVEPLSVREQDVLRLAAFGASNQAIAESLVISVGTVKSHVNRILSKLAAHNRTEAVARARELGLL